MRAFSSSLLHLTKEYPNNNEDTTTSEANATMADALLRRIRTRMDQERLKMGGTPTMRPQKEGRTGKVTESDRNLNCALVGPGYSKPLMQNESLAHKFFWSRTVLCIERLFGDCHFWTHTCM